MRMGRARQRAISMLEDLGRSAFAFLRRPAGRGQPLNSQPSSWNYVKQRSIVGVASFQNRSDQAVALARSR